MHRHKQIYRNCIIKRCVQPLLVTSIMRDVVHSSIAVVTWLGFLSTNMAPLSLVLVELVVATYARSWTSDTHRFDWNLLLGLC